MKKIILLSFLSIFCIASCQQKTKPATNENGRIIKVPSDQNINYKENVNH